QREMSVFIIVQILDQCIVIGKKEVVGGRGPVMLLRVEPARGDVAVPAECYLAVRNHAGGGARAAHERQRQRRRGKRARRQYPAPGQHPIRHILLLFYLRQSRASRASHWAAATGDDIY